MTLFRYTFALMMAVSILVFPIANADALKDQKLIEQKLLKVNKNLTVESLKPSDIEGFYTVRLSSGDKLYVDKTGNYFFSGSLFAIQNDKIVNLTDKEEAMERVALVKEFNPAEMIVFSPKPPVKTKVSINVFTDVDCFYCQKLHKEVPELNAMGIEVRYLAFPRAGVGSGSYKKIVSAWCAEDPHTSITKLKNKQDIPQKTCDNPVAKQYELGQRMGVSGTPAIILEDGSLIPGYRPAAKLAESLGI